MIARPVADLDGATTQLLLPSASSGVGAAASSTGAAGLPSAAAVLGAARLTVTFWVASVKTLRTSLGRQGSSPSGTFASHGGWSPKRSASAFTSALQAVFARATSLVRFR